MNLERLNSPAIVYAWSDHLTGKVYCGSHKGSDDDGYICSSKYMLKEYKQRPQDFTRQIIAKGIWKDCIALEKKINEQLIKDVKTTYNKQAFPAIVNEVHPMTGKKFSDEHKRKLRIAKLGKKQLKPRKPITEETRKKLSESHKGLIQSEETRAKNSVSNKGKVISEKQRLKISLTHKGKIVSKETKEKLRISHLGKTPWNKGLKTSNETREKMKTSWILRKQRSKNASLA